MIADAPSILPISISLPVSGIGASCRTTRGFARGPVSGQRQSWHHSHRVRDACEFRRFSGHRKQCHRDWPRLQDERTHFPAEACTGAEKELLGRYLLPSRPGPSTGTIAVTSDAANSVVSLPVTAIAVASGALISNPSILSFGTVQVNHGQMLSATLTNSGSSTVTLSRASISGSGFALSGVTLPLTLGPGQSTSLKVSFNPQSGGAVNASLSVISDAVNGTLAVPLSGTGATTGALNSTPSSLSFGNVPAGSPKTLSGTLVNSGGSSITITQANVSVSWLRVKWLDPACYSGRWAKQSL